MGKVTGFKKWLSLLLLLGVCLPMFISCGNNATESVTDSGSTSTSSVGFDFVSSASENSNSVNEDNSTSGGGLINGGIFEAH